MACWFRLSFFLDVVLCFFLIMANLFVVMFLLFVFLYIIYLLFDCQYHRNLLPGKSRPRNDLLYVEWDVKLYTLTHLLS